MLLPRSLDRANHHVSTPNDDFVTTLYVVVVCFVKRHKSSIIPIIKANMTWEVVKLNQTRKVYITCPKVGSGQGAVPSRTLHI